MINILHTHVDARTVVWRICVFIIYQRRPYDGNISNNSNGPSKS